MATSDNVNTIDTTTPAASFLVSSLTRMDIGKTTAGSSASVLEINLAGALPGATGINMSASVLQMAMDAEVTIVSNIVGDASVVEIEAAGTVAMVNSINGDASVLRIDLGSASFQAGGIDLSAAVVLITLDGSAVISQTQVFDTPADTDYPYITGDVYIVVNLRTKTHTTYRDGSNDALARTGILDFGSIMMKNVSDAYVLGRADGDAEFIVDSGEETSRKYPLNYGVLTQAALKNKKLGLAKGLQAPGWQFAVVATGGRHSEVREVNLLVNELDRRVGGT